MSVLFIFCDVLLIIFALYPYLFRNVFFKYENVSVLFILRTLYRADANHIIAPKNLLNLSHFLVVISGLVQSHIIEIRNSCYAT